MHRHQPPDEVPAHDAPKATTWFLECCEKPHSRQHKDVMRDFCSVSESDSRINLKCSAKATGCTTPDVQRKLIRWSNMRMSHGMGGPEGVWILKGVQSFAVAWCQLLLPTLDVLQRIHPCEREPRRELPSTPDCRGLPGEINPSARRMADRHAPFRNPGMDFVRHRRCLKTTSRTSASHWKLSRNLSTRTATRESMLSVPERSQKSSSKQWDQRDPPESVRLSPALEGLPYEALIVLHPHRCPSL